MRQKNRTVIQINSIEVLERLIGGNTELEVDLRNSVAQAFATKHIKKFQAVLDEAIQKEIEALQFAIVRTHKSRWNVDIHPDIKKDIQETVTPYIKHQIRQEALRDFNKRVATEVQKVSEEYETYVWDALQKKTNQRLIEFFECALDDIIQKHIGYVERTTNELDAGAQTTSED